MTTRNFSATKLPYPRYSLEVGKFCLPPKKQEGCNREKQPLKKHKASAKDDIVDRFNISNQLKLPPTCLPRFSHLIQIVEVKETGNSIPGRAGSHIQNFLGSHVVLENFRPELFLRRDFISKFVNSGRVFISQIPDDSNPDYKVSMNIDNVMIITLNAKQYRRFGLIAKKVTSLAPENYGLKEKCYHVEIDLKNDKLMKNNKFQDKMMNMLRRLSPVNKIYFRFAPHTDKSDSLSITAANEFSVEYFKYVIEEYALDGCEPVPLTKCSAVCQRIEKHWLNCAQLHPKLNVIHTISDQRELSRINGLGIDGQNNLSGSDFENDKLINIIEVINWLGYQLLKLDCDRTEIKSNYPDGGNPRYDVSCTQIVGAMDHQHVESNIRNLFGTRRPDDQGVILRALFLYNMNQLRYASGANASLENVCPYLNAGNNSGVVYIQDCNNGSKAANEITVIGMSALAG